MNRKFSFFLMATAVCQLLTAIFHSISFFVKTAPANDTERQLTELVDNYKMDAGMGFHPSYSNIFISLSACFTLICLFAALLNLFFKKLQLSAAQWKGYLLIQTFIFSIVFAVMAVFTFLPPIACTGLIFIFCLGAYLTVPRHTV